MVRFYEKFYGRFNDNEEAIELLCKYFPQGLEKENYNEQIAKALYKHVFSAGTPNDTGYAFQGIARIESYIGALPVVIIEKLLSLYQARLITYNPVYRHQVYAIIMRSQIRNTDKSVLKFFCWIL